MNMKLKLLASTVSVLCFSQVSMADVTSTVVLNGSSYTYTRPTVDEALNPKGNEVEDLAAYFPVNGAPATSGVGLITRVVDSASSDKTFIIISNTGKSATIETLTNGQQTGEIVVIEAGTVVQTREAVTAYVKDSLAAKATYPKIISSATKDPNTFAKALNSVDKAAATVAVATVSPNATAAEAALTAANLTSFVSDVKVGQSTVDSLMATTDYVVATVIHNGAVKGYTYATQDEMWADLNTPQDNAKDFNNATTTTGMVAEITYKGKTYTTIRDGGKSMIVAEFQPDGTLTLKQITAATISGVNKNAQAYINGDATKAVLLAQDSAAAQKALDAIRAAQKVAGVSPTTLISLVKTENALAALIIPPIDLGLQSKVAGYANQIGTKEALADYEAAKNDNQKMNALLAMMRTNKYVSRVSSSSGIAGNPTSAMNTTMDAMFNQVADYGQGTKASLGSNALFSGSASVQYGYYDLNGRSAHAVTMPLSLSSKLGSRGELVLTVPLTYIATDTQPDAYQVGAILGYKYHVNDHWDIMPAAAYTYRNFDSANVNNAFRRNTSMVGGTVSSKYTWDWQPMSMKISMTNMVGYVESLDAGSANTVPTYMTKNGLHLTKAVGNMVVGVYFTDTEYFGAKRALYYDQFNEAGFSIKPQGLGAAVDALSLDANYLFNIGGNNEGNIDGFRVNLGYKF